MTLYDEFVALDTKLNFDELRMTREVFENCEPESQENMVEQFRQAIESEERYAEYLQLRATADYPTGPMSKREWDSFDYDGKSRLIKSVHARLAERKEKAERYLQQHGEVW